MSTLYHLATNRVSRQHWISHGHFLSTPVTSSYWPSSRCLGLHRCEARERYCDRENIQLGTKLPIHNPQLPWDCQVATAVISVRRSRIENSIQFEVFLIAFQKRILVITSSWKGINSVPLIHSKNWDASDWQLENEALQDRFCDAMTLAVDHAAS